MPWEGIIFFFLFGTIAGSFLNVLTLRHGASGLSGRSRCLSCGKTLAWSELIPLLSFFLQRRRCRGCKSRISWQYPLVELATGLIFALVFWKHFSVLPLFSYSVIQLLVVCLELLLWSVLIALAVYDIRHKIIPNSFVYGLCFFSFLYLITSYFIFHTSYFLDFWGGPLLALALAAVWFFSHGRAMGLGDAKLALGLGWFLGLSLAFSAVVVAFWTGAIVGLCLIAFSKMRSARGNYGMKSEIPFALYLAFGAFLAFIFEFTFLTLVFRLR